MTKPKHCPFCGSDYVAIVEIPPSESHHNTRTTFHVECRECNESGPQPMAPQTREGAIAEWNLYARGKRSIETKRGPCAQPAAVSGTGTTTAVPTAQVSGAGTVTRRG